ncbi:MAG: histidine kinase dimerization/phospho-acceptor domain-containing protein, partial [Pseudomonadota bacterium]
MDIHSTISGDESTGEMGDLEKVLEKLTAHRWILGAALFVFLVLVSIGLLDAITAIGCIIILFATALLSPIKSKQADASTIVAVDSAEIYDEAFAFLNVIPDPVMLIGQSGSIEFTNPEFDTAFGTTEKGASSLLRFRSPDIQKIIQEVMDGGNPTPIEYAETKPISRWFSVSAKAVKFNTANELYLVHFHDLSETKHTERVRSDFIANASHELRTPLASLTGFIETLAGPARNDEHARDRFLKIMQDQAERMSRLIDDLLTLSRIETGKGRSQFTNVGVKDALMHVIDALRPMAQGSNTEIKSDISDTQNEVFVHGSGDELIQLFENLIENAIKYGGENGKVEIVLTEPNKADEITVEIRDNGPGIPEEHIPRLVERFYRVDVETSRGKQGTGLGLS